MCRVLFFVLFQDIMADNMREILGDMLYTDPPNDEKNEMPSPEFLKGKILVKAKRLPPGKGPEDELEVEEDDEIGIWWTN